MNSFSPPLNRSCNKDLFSVRPFSQKVSAQQADGISQCPKFQHFDISSCSQSMSEGICCARSEACQYHWSRQKEPPEWDLVWTSNPQLRWVNIQHTWEGGTVWKESSLFCSRIGVQWVMSCQERRLGDRRSLGRNLPLYLILGTLCM